MKKILVKEGLFVMGCDKNPSIEDHFFYQDLIIVEWIA